MFESNCLGRNKKWLISAFEQTPPQSIEVDWRDGTLIFMWEIHSKLNNCRFITRSAQEIVNRHVSTSLRYVLHLIIALVGNLLIGLQGDRYFLHVI